MWLLPYLMPQWKWDICFVKCNVDYNAVITLLLVTQYQQNGLVHACMKVYIYVRNIAISGE